MKNNLLVFLSLSLIFFFGCKSDVNYRKISGSAFATTYHVVYKDSENLDLSNQIDSILDAINSSLSVYDSNSVVSRINSNKTTLVDSVFVRTFTVCKLVSDSSSGAFDITSAPLINAWGFGNKRRANLDELKIDSLLQYVGYKKVVMVDGSIRKDNPKVIMDLSSVGDGFAVDEVVSLLERNGIANYMVEIGGEVKARGLSARIDSWRIGIDKPIDDSLALNRELNAVVILDGLSLSTSGSYRKYFIRDGKKYSHFIDPYTCRPVTHTLLSASVIHSNCALADGFSTAFMVMGLEKSLAYLQNDTTLAAYFIFQDGDSLKVQTANGFEKYLSK